MTFEAWLAQHWFNVLSTLVFLVSIVAHYLKTNSHIEALQTTVNELKVDLDRLKAGGLPFVCSQHEQRLGKLEELINRALVTIQADISELKQIARDNREMIRNHKTEQ